MPDLTLERLQLFLLVVMPGIIAIKVYDLFYPPEKRDFGSSLLEAAAYGLLNMGIWVWPVVHINKKEFIEQYPVWYAILSFCFLVLSPVGLALVAVKIRNTQRLGRLLGYPTKSAWDVFFRRRQECWILFHLKNGKLLGGYFGEKSYATAFPQPSEVYVEEVWRVGEDGVFAEMVPGTIGMVIRQADCERLEFLCVEEETTNGQKNLTNPVTARSILMSKRGIPQRDGRDTTPHRRPVTERFRRAAPVQHPQRITTRGSDCLTVQRG